MYLKVLRKWKRTKINRNNFLEAIRRYKRNVDREKKQRGEKEEKEINEIRTEKEVWKYINRERKKNESVNDGKSTS
jgi:hypothetical protein